MRRFIVFVSLFSLAAVVFLVGCGGVTIASSSGGTPVVITTTNLSNATVSGAYQQTLTASGGTPPYAWSVVSGALPTGVSLATNGTITGTPTKAGSYTFTVQVTDAHDATKTASYNITCTAGLEITTSSLPDGTVSSAYNQSLAATGGDPPYRWTVDSGSLPAGLTLSSRGVLAGTPTTSGTSTFSVEVADSKSTTKTASFTLKIDSGEASSLRITTTNLHSADVSVLYQQTLTASGGTPPYTWTVVSGMLPAGLSLASDGTISGSPTTAGTSTFSVQVADSASAKKTATFSITVTAALAITTTNLPEGFAGSVYDATLAATGGAVPYAWTIASGSLPAGISLASNGTISGTPTTAGSSTFTLRVTDSALATKTASFTVTVAAGVTITTTSLPGATVGTAYHEALAASGGTAPYTWSVTAGALPAGLSLASNGTISGTPTAAGSSTFTVHVADANANTKTASFTISVSAALAITTTSLPDATVGVPYQQTLAANGGRSPYTWRVSVGSLPNGLSIATSGTISGTPAAAGSSTFTVEVTDSASATKTASLTLTVVSGLMITTTSLPSAQAGRPYQATLVVAGGTAPYTWTMASGSLAAGLSLTSNGTIAGTPTSAGTSTFTVRVTDSASANKTATLTLTVTAALAITTTSVTSAVVGVPFSQTLAATGGVTPYTWALTSGTLPAGLTLSGSGAISGTATTAGSSAFTVQVTDADSTTRSASFTMTVTTTSSQQYTLGDTAYPYPTPGKPAKAGMVTDPTLHIPVTRVTDGVNDGAGGSLTVNYSTWNPLSSDGKYLLFQGNQGNGGFHVYDAHTYAHIKVIPVLEWWNSEDPEPRWDYSGAHPSWIYYRKDMTLRYYDISDDSDHLLHDFSVDFPAYPSSGGYFVWNGQEGIPSRDSRYFPLMIAHSSTNCPLAVVYDRVADTVVSSHDISPSGCPNNVSMSPSGNYFYAAYTWTGHGGEFDGPHLYTRDFSVNHHAFTDVPHASWAWTAQGHEVIVGSGDDVLLGSDYFGYVRADTGQAYTLDWIGHVGWNEGGANLAYTDQHGWAFFSTYGSTTGNTPSSDWSAMEVFAYELDETKTWSPSLGKTSARIWRIAFTQCFGNTYDEQANAAMDFSGTRIWWGSNWRSAGAAMDIYQANLPATWETDLANLK